MKTPHMVSVLPSELLTEILLQLPVKTLMRCTCVCKSWKSLISDGPSFVKSHLKRSAKNTHILLTLEDGNRDVENKDTRVVPCSVRCFLEEEPSTINDKICYCLKDKYLVVGSCNGLVCLGSFYGVGRIEEFHVQLWNPATHLNSKKSPILRMKLQTVVGAQRGKVNFGFGYDDSSDTYKVVVVFWDCRKEKMEIRVHCMGDNCWRQISCDLNFPRLLNIIDGKFVGGCVNWLALKDLNGPKYKWEHVTLQRLVIVSFDMGEEVYKYFSLPEGISGVPYDEPKLAVLGNHMCLCHDQDRSHFVLWQMREYGVQESWTQMVSVAYVDLQFEGYLGHLSPMWLSEDGDILLIANKEDLEVIKYNVRDDDVEYFELNNNEVCVRANDYVPSLVSPYRD